MNKITKVGIYRVEDSARPYYYGEDLTSRELGRYQVRAVKTILKEVKNVEPDILKFARNTMDLSKKEFAEKVGCKEEQVSNWEAGTSPINEKVQTLYLNELNKIEPNSDNLKLLAYYREKLENDS